MLLLESGEFVSPLVVGGWGEAERERLGAVDDVSMSAAGRSVMGWSMSGTPDMVTNESVWRRCAPSHGLEVREHPRKAVGH